MKNKIYLRVTAYSFFAILYNVNIHSEVLPSISFTNLNPYKPFKILLLEDEFQLKSGIINREKPMIFFKEETGAIYRQIEILKDTLPETQIEIRSHNNDKCDSCNYISHEKDNINIQARKSLGSANDYCIPASRFCHLGDAITNVKIKKDTTIILDNTSGCTNGGYELYTIPAYLNKGDEYQLSISIDVATWVHSVKAWIDFNKNFEFEAGEIIFFKALTGNWKTETQSFTVPGNSSSGEFRMRVKSNWNAEVNDACTNNSNHGETEDYIINIVSGCPDLVNLTSPSNNITSGAQTIQASESNGEIYASNKISGSAKVIFEASSIQMDPGFTVSSGAVFTAKPGGCN